MEEAKILVVDDDAHALDLSALILTNDGYQVFKASNGAEAIQKAQEVMPDLLVVDLMLPDMNGGEIVQALREKLQCQAPAIFLTGMITKEEESGEAAAIKINDANYATMAKPLDQDKFLALVRAKLTK